MRQKFYFLFVFLAIIVGMAFFTLLTPRIQAGWGNDVTAPTTTFGPFSNITWVGGSCSLLSPDVLGCTSATTSVDIPIECNDTPWLSGCKAIVHIILTPPAPAPAHPASLASPAPWTAYIATTPGITPSPIPNPVSTTVTVDSSAGNSQIIYAYSQDATGNSFATNSTYLVKFATIVSGTIQFDTDNNDSAAGEPGIDGVIVTLASNTNNYTATTNASGIYSFPSVIPDTYRVSFTDTSPYVYKHPLAPDLVVNGTTIQDYLFRGFIVKGRVFNDNNKNELFDLVGGDTNYTAGINTSNFTVAYKSQLPLYAKPTPLITVNSAEGTYTITGLMGSSASDDYVSIGYNLPPGYKPTGPSSATWQAQVMQFGTTPGTGLWTFAPPATTGGTSYPVAYAPGGSPPDDNAIAPLNFGIKNSDPWYQIIGSDIRKDNGVNNPVPPGLFMLSKGPTDPHGVIFTGSGPRGFCFSSTPGYPCENRSSTKGWIAGDSSHPEVFSPPPSNTIRTSYAAVSNAINRNNVPTPALASKCSNNNISDCTLTNIDKGVYTATGDVGLNTYTFTGGNDYIFLIDGNLTIKGNILVENGTTATFIVSGDITIDPGVGQDSANHDKDCSSRTNCNIEGIYSADNSFIVSSDPLNNNVPCSFVPDKRLNISGSIIVNAARVTGVGAGVFTQKRDLCGNDSFYPAVQIAERADFLINLPEILKSSNFLWQEAAP